MRLAFSHMIQDKATMRSLDALASGHSPVRYACMSESVKKSIHLLTHYRCYDEEYAAACSIYRTPTQPCVAARHVSMLRERHCRAHRTSSRPGSERDGSDGSTAGIRKTGCWGPLGKGRLIYGPGTKSVDRAGPLSIDCISSRPKKKA